MESVCVRRTSDRNQLKFLDVKGLVFSYVHTENVTH